MRHCAVLRRGDCLHIFWTQVGEAPERVRHSTIDLRPDWTAWRETGGEEVLRPERSWEGADAPLVPSIRSTAYGYVNQLRDPAIFEEDGATYLLYHSYSGPGRNSKRSSASARSVNPSPGRSGA